MKTIGAFLWENRELSYLLIELDPSKLKVIERDWVPPVKIDKDHKSDAKKMIKTFCEKLKKSKNPTIEYKTYMDSPSAIRVRFPRKLKELSDGVDSAFIHSTLLEQAKYNHIELADHQLKSSSLKGDTLQSFKNFLEKTIYSNSNKKVTKRIY